MYVIPRYAAKWRRTGALLGLSTGVLDIIENDCRGKAESCCNAMFERWLDTDHTASWRKLFDAGIELPAMHVTDGKVINECMCWYIATMANFITICAPYMGNPKHR